VFFWNYFEIFLSLSKNVGLKLVNSILEERFQTFVFLKICLSGVWIKENCHTGMCGRVVKT
jgi:hypothetical protein